MRKIQESQNKTLKVEKKMKIVNNNGRNIVTAEWFDNELQASVKIRGKKSKAWRIAMRKNESKEKIDRLEWKYKIQQKVTSHLIGTKKGALEKDKIKVARTNNKQYGL